MTSEPKTEAMKRINKKIALPSPSLQNFLKNVVSDDNEYLIFLENIQGSLTRHGIELADDISEKLLLDFRFAVDRAREAIKNDKPRLKFEDIFKIPLVKIDAGRLHVNNVAAVVDTSMDVYYSENKTEENRGRSTGFDPKTESVTRRETESWHTTKFSGTSIFKNNYRRERFDRSPLLSADIMRQIIEAVNIGRK